MGAQARQAARAQPPAARRDRHHLHRRRTASPVLPAGVRYVITLDADTRLPRDAVAAPGRQDGASAQPPALRRRDRPGGRRLRCCSRASRRPCRSARKARCSSASSPAPAASTPTRRRCRTSTRTCSAKAPTPARASTTSTRSRRRCAGRVPENALLSHDLFEGVFARAGPGLRHRGGRGVSRALRRRRARASTAGRAATGSCCPGSSVA